MSIYILVVLIIVFLLIQFLKEEKEVSKFDLDDWIMVICFSVTVLPLVLVLLSLIPYRKILSYKVF